MRILAAALASAMLFISAPVAASASTAAPACKKENEVGSYFSPGGRANIRLSPEFKRVLQGLGMGVTGIAPVTVSLDTGDIHMPIGGSFDKLGAFGEILYPGGFKAASATGSIAVDCFWLRTFPSGVYTSISFNGGPPSVHEFGTFKVIDGLKGFRPDPSAEGQITVGWVPFSLTQEMADLLNKNFGVNLKQGMLLGWLEGRFNFADAKSFAENMIKLVKDPMQAASLLTAAPGLAAIGVGLLPGLATGFIPSDLSVAGIGSPAGH